MSSHISPVNTLLLPQVPKRPTTSWLTRNPRGGGLQDTVPLLSLASLLVGGESESHTVVSNSLQSRGP